MAVAVVTPGNLGYEFDLGVLEASKIHIKTVAAHMTFAGSLGPIPPNTFVLVPFNTMVHNVGGAGVIGAGAGWTAPYACIVHVDVQTFWGYEAWLQAGSPGVGAGTVAASNGVFKNGVFVAQPGVDYSIKGGMAIAGSANEFKVPTGGIDVQCLAGDVLTIRAANGQSSGNSHTVLSAYASFHIVH